MRSTGAIFVAPNQKIITTKKTLSDDEHIYGICNIDATLTAARILTDRAFKLYLRMSLHQDGYTYALSPVEISNSIGMSDKRYRDAVNELIDKHFLVSSEKHKNVFTFYENPNCVNELQETKPKLKVNVKISILT